MSTASFDNQNITKYIREKTLSQEEMVADRMATRTTYFFNIIERAIMAGDVEEIKWALENSTISIKDMCFRRYMDSGERRFNAIGLAAFCGNQNAINVINYLIQEHGFSPEKCMPDNEMSAIQVAAKKHNALAIIGFLQNGADPFSNQYSSNTQGNILFANTKEDDIDFFNLMMDIPDISSRINDSLPWGMYKIPVLFLMTENVKTLRNFLAIPQADPLVRSTHGDTEGFNALHWLVKNHSGRAPWKERFKLLKKAGLSLSDRTKAGVSAFELAKENREFSKEEILFLEKDALQDVAKNNGVPMKKRTPSSGL